MTRATLLALGLASCGGAVAPHEAPDGGDECVARQVVCLHERIHALSDVDAGVHDCELTWEHCVGEIP